MQPLHHVSAIELYAFRGQGGGQAFTAFCDSLIRAQAFAVGIPQTAIHTNIRTNIKDGGVDTKVDCAISTKQGLLDAKTVWQYKAREYKSVSRSIIKEELEGDFVRKCLKGGFEYRLAICDSMPPDKQQDLGDDLNAELALIHPTATGLIVTAEELKEWVNLFPMLTALYFNKGLVNFGLRLDAWAAGITSATRHYVSVPDWQAIEKQVEAQIDFAQPSGDVVLGIAGDAGVGKTRLVYETLARTNGSNGFVIYTGDETRASEIATYLANAANSYAILVADECSLKAQYRLREILRGDNNRIRVIAIEVGNDARLAPEYVMTKMPDGLMLEILARNFPSVPQERREGYAALAEGYVRFAADLCLHDSALQSGGVGSSRVDLQACKLEYSIVSPK